MKLFFLRLSLCLLFLFSATFIYKNKEQIATDCLRNMDRSLSELHIELAKDFQAHTGAFSRFNFRHPEPLLYYVLAGFDSVHQLGQSHYESYRVYFLIFNCILIASALVTFSKFLPSWILLLIFPLLIVNIDHSRQFLLFNYWNPNILPSATLLFIAAVIYFSLGNTSLIYHIIFSGSLAMQSHLSAVPVVIITLFLALLYNYRYFAWREFFRSKYFYSGLLLLLLIWLPVLANAIYMYDFGNLGKIAAFLFPSESHHSLFKGIATLHRLTLPNFVTEQVAPFGALLPFSLLSLLFIKNISRGCRTLLVVCPFIAAWTIIATTKIKGAVNLYLLYYYLAFNTMALAILLGCVVFYLNKAINKWLAPSANGAIPFLVEN